MFKIYALLFGLLLSSAAPGDDATPASVDNADIPEATHVSMHKNPGCSCCDKWAEHMRSYGFVVDIEADPEILNFKAKYNIPRPLMSCHTAIIDGYFVEGHVPAQDILTLLKEKPESVTGISAPGMPLGSPGMEHPRPQAFNTIALLTDGSAYVYKSHKAGEDFSAGAKD
jgi:hypothetical protein